MSTAIAAVRADLAALTDRVTRLEARTGSGPRGAADVRLLVAIAESAGDRGFGAAELLRHSQVDARLARALAAAFIESPRELGHRLRRLEGRPCAGLVLQREGSDRAGLVWRVQREDISQTRTG